MESLLAIASTLAFTLNETRSCCRILTNRMTFTRTYIYLHFKRVPCLLCGTEGKAGAGTGRPVQEAAARLQPGGTVPQRQWPRGGSSVEKGLFQHVGCANPHIFLKDWMKGAREKTDIKNKFQFRITFSERLVIKGGEEKTQHLDSQF